MRTKPGYDVYLEGVILILKAADILFCHIGAIEITRLRSTG